MIAIFTVKEEPCSPLKRKKGNKTTSKASPEDEQAIFDIFDTLAETLPRRHRAELQEHMLRDCNGIAYTA